MTERDYSNRDRQTDRGRDRETETQRDRDRQRGRQKNRGRDRERRGGYTSVEGAQYWCILQLSPKTVALAAGGPPLGPVKSSVWSPL